MNILGVIALFWGVQAYAVTSPTSDIYSDSLTIQRSSAEIPQSFDATITADLAADTTDEQPIESVSDLVESARPKAKKSAKN